MNKITLTAIIGGAVLLIAEFLAIYTDTASIIVYPILITGIILLVISAVAFYKHVSDYEKKRLNADETTKKDQP